MAPTESFDELEQQLAERIEEALSEIRQEFLERVQSAAGELREMVGSEMATVRDQATAAGAEAEATRAALLAEAEEIKQAAIADAVAAKEAELREMLQRLEATLTEVEQARDAALAEAQSARDEAQSAREAAFAEVEESREAGIAEALAAKEAELGERLTEKDRVIAEVEATRERDLGELREEMESALAAAHAAAEETLTGAVSAVILGLHERVADLDSGSSQAEILESLLASTSRYASRSILFLTREDGLQGWGGQGFEIEADRLQSLHLDYQEGTAWAELAEGRGTVEISGEVCANLCRDVDGSQPIDGVLIPLVLRDRLAAALYADRLSDAADFQVPVLQILAYIAGQVLETLPMRQRAATPTLRLVGDAAPDDPGLDLWQFLVPDETMVEEPTVEESITAETVERPMPLPVEEEPALEPAEIGSEAPVEDYQPSDYIGAEETGFTVEDEMSEAGPAPVAEEPAAEPEYPVDEAPSVVEVKPPAAVTPPTSAGAEVAPPDDVDGPGWAFTTRRFGDGSEEDSGHEEARRLARLLVTEIKLYNEEQVEEGRRGRNIYRSLRDDIDRSKQIYEERIDETVRANTDYFREELVRILAGGDEEVMGM